MTELKTTSARRQVVSAPARALHGILALAFGFGYLTGDSDYWQPVHFAMGYTILGAFLLRLVWGWLAGRSEQPQAWLLRARTAWSWTRSMVLSPSWREISIDKVAHHLVGMSIVVLLFAVVATAASGYLMSRDWGLGWLEDILSELHEALADGAVVALCVHLAAVMVVTWRRGTQWLMRMWHGQVAGKGPDLIKHNAAPFAVVIFLSTAIFWWTSWVGWLQVT